MKTLYITIFFLAGIVSYKAQENKTAEKQDEIQSIKDSKAFEQKMMKAAAEKKTETKTSQLASEQGMDIKKQSSDAKSNSSNTSGKLLPNTASLEEVLAAIPNRKVNHTSPKTTNNVKGIPNTATLEEIKKTIPKN